MLIGLGNLYCDRKRGSRSVAVLIPGSQELSSLVDEASKSPQRSTYGSRNI